MASRITTDIDWRRPGRQVSILRVPSSDNRHAYGFIPVPISVLGSTGGPTTLVCAGTHGDEYEGQVIVRRLLHQLHDDQLAGRLILIPGLNAPAVCAGKRCSPIDGGDLNRAFPGSADGTTTAAIAHFLDSEILPHCDLVLDLHSGGGSSTFLPCTFIYGSGESALVTKKVQACEAFAAPWTIVVNPGESRSLSAAAERRGLVMVATELAGGAGIDAGAVRIGLAGVLRVLHQFGILHTDPPIADTSSRFLLMRHKNGSVSAPGDGLFEPACELGDTVEAGATAGWLHRLDTPEIQPLRLTFVGSGIVARKRVPARVQRGDYLFHLGREMDPTELIAERGNPPQ